MIKLSPSILAADYANLGSAIKKAEAAGAQYLHIDVMDGHFVPALSLGMCVISSIRKVSDIVFDVHLMITEPERYIEDFAKCGADIITFHLEACDCVEETIDRIHALGVKAGISIKPNTPTSTLEPYLSKVDMVLIMTVEPGFGGQKYMDSCTEKIRETKRMMRKQGLDIELEVDGGLSRGNIKTAVDAGANVIVAGSSVFNGDIAENIKGLFSALSEA